MTIRVVRLMEYHYADAERMAADMAGWTLQGPPGANYSKARMSFRSAVLTPEFLEGQMDGTNDYVEVYPHDDGEGNTVYDWRRKDLDNHKIVSTSGNQGYVDLAAATDAAGAINPGLEVKVVEAE